MLRSQLVATSSRPCRNHSPSQASENTVADTLRQAVGRHQRGQLGEAETLYRLALDSDPDNFDALHLCGVLKYQSGEHANALKLIARALKTNTRSAAAHSHYGMVLAMLGRIEDALNSYDRAIALKPDFAEALNNRGNALRALKRSHDALASFDRALPCGLTTRRRSTIAEIPWSSWAGPRMRWKVTTVPWHTARNMWTP